MFRSLNDNNVSYIYLSLLYSIVSVFSYSCDFIHFLDRERIVENIYSPFMLRRCMYVVPQILDFYKLFSATNVQQNITLLSVEMLKSLMTIVRYSR